jgi:hypothetical protein
MWTLGNSSNNIDSDFTRYLESEEYVAQQHYHRQRFSTDVPPSLLDIIGAWLASGDNALYIPAYEDLFIAIMGWIDEWIATDRKVLMGAALWKVDGVELQIPYLVHSAETDREPSDHPVLSRAVFDNCQNVARNRRAFDSLVKLDELLEIARSAPNKK